MAKHRHSTPTADPLARALARVRITEWLREYHTTLAALMGT